MGAGRRRGWWNYDKCEPPIETHKPCTCHGELEEDYGRFESERSEGGVSSKGHASRINRIEV